MNRNLPISSRISVDVQQLFDDLIVVKCNVNNKEFQGILLNTSKSFFGINESRLKSGPESLSLKEADKGNVSFSCSVERYSYKLDGTGPSIFTRHPVKRHKSPPASGKHVICQKCQSVVTIPDQVEKQVPATSSDDGGDLGSGRSYNRRKSQAAPPRRLSNFDTRENFESNHFIDVRPETTATAIPDSATVGLGSNITQIKPSAGLLDVKKILKKKKKKDRERLKEKSKEAAEVDTKPSPSKEESKPKKRRLEADSRPDRSPMKKAKLVDSEPSEKSKKAKLLDFFPAPPDQTRKGKSESVEEKVKKSSATEPPEKTRREGKHGKEHSRPVKTERPLKKMKWDNLLAKKLKKKRKSDRAFGKTEDADSRPSPPPAANGKPEEKRSTPKPPVEAASAPPAAPAAPIVPASPTAPPAAEEERGEQGAEQGAVAVLQKLMRSSLTDAECEVTSLQPETARRRSGESPADSSLSLKIKINRSLADNGGYQCHIVGDENHTVSSSTAENPPTSPLAAQPADPPVAQLVSQPTLPPAVPPAEVERSRFAVGDVVWAKITGYPWWPARITVIRAQEAEVLWFNWDQISYIPCDKLFHFLEHYKAKCDKKRKGMYRNAVEQAWMAAQAAQSIAEDEEEEEETAAAAVATTLPGPSSANSTPSQVSSSSTPGTRLPPSSGSSAVTSELPVSSTNLAHPQSDDESDSGLVIDTELAALAPV